MGNNSSRWCPRSQESCQAERVHGHDQAISWCGHAPRVGRWDRRCSLHPMRYRPMMPYSVEHGVHESSHVRRVLMGMMAQMHAWARWVVSEFGPGGLHTDGYIDSAPQKTFFLVRFEMPLSRLVV